MLIVAEGFKSSNLKISVTCEDGYHVKENYTSAVKVNKRAHRFAFNQIRKSKTICSCEVLPGQWFSNFDFMLTSLQRTLTRRTKVNNVKFIASVVDQIVRFDIRVNNLV